MYTCKYSRKIVVVESMIYLGFNFNVACLPISAIYMLIRVLRYTEYQSCISVKECSRESEMLWYQRIVVCVAQIEFTLPTKTTEAILWKGISKKVSKECPGASLFSFDFQYE